MPLLCISSKIYLLVLSTNFAYLLYRPRLRIYKEFKFLFHHQGNKKLLPQSSKNSFDFLGSTLLLELRNTLASLLKQIYIDLQKMK